MLDSSHLTEQQYAVVIIIAYGFFPDEDLAPVQKLEQASYLPFGSGAIPTESSVEMILTSTSEFTKERHDLLSEIQEYYSLPAGWDGETDEITNPDCLDVAKKFVAMMEPGQQLPEFSAGTGSEVSLFWDRGDFYLIVHCLPEGWIKFYYEEGEKKLTGIAPLVDEIPPEISVLIRSHPFGISRTLGASA